MEIGCWVTTMHTREKNFATLELGDRRLNERAMIAMLCLGFGKALSSILVVEPYSKEPMSFANPKCNFRN